MNLKTFCSNRNFLTTEEWHNYFRSHRNVLETIVWEEGRYLTDDEKLLISASIQEFQLGESSEGRHLNEFAKDYSKKTNDPLYYESIKFFIREEQRHAQALGRFMEREGIPKLRKSFVDSVFRHLRRYAGLEISITVLLMAEIISLVYYRSLRDATSSPLLKKICRELLKDERAHLRFHCERLAILRRNYGFRLWILHVLQGILLTGTCAAVWLNHGSVLSASYSPIQYWDRVWKIYKLGLRKMNLPSIQPGRIFASKRDRNSLILRRLRPQSLRPTRV